MKYILVKWVHTSPDYPVLLSSELDEDRFEIRKVEVFRDGKMGYAGDPRRGGDDGSGVGRGHQTYFRVADRSDEIWINKI